MLDWSCYFVAVGRTAYDLSLCLLPFVYCPFSFRYRLSLGAGGGPMSGLATDVTFAFKLEEVELWWRVFIVDLRGMALVLLMFALLLHCRLGQTCVDS